MDVDFSIVVVAPASLETSLPPSSMPCQPPNLPFDNTSTPSFHHLQQEQSDAIPESLKNIQSVGKMQVSRLIVSATDEHSSSPSSIADRPTALESQNLKLGTENEPLKAQIMSLKSRVGTLEETMTNPILQTIGQPIKRGSRCSRNYHPKPVEWSGLSLTQRRELLQSSKVLMELKARR